MGCPVSMPCKYTHTHTCMHTRGHRTHANTPSLVVHACTQRVPGFCAAALPLTHSLTHACICTQRVPGFCAAALPLYYGRVTPVDNSP